MKRLLVLTIVIASASLIAGCGSPAPEETAAPEPTAIPEAVEPVVELAMVEVSAEGTEFDPPVAIEQIPEGSWYCDMGTVHYARAEEGDGTCALCKMNLKHKIAEETADAPVDETASAG